MTTIGQFPIFISAPPSLCSLRHRGCHSDREWRADPWCLAHRPDCGKHRAPHLRVLSPLVPGTGFSVPVNTALAEEVVNHNQELNFSPIFCNNRSILWSIMALQWIWGGVTMRTIIMPPPGCEIIKRRWELCFASRKWDFSRTFSHSSWQ